MYSLYFLLNNIKVKKILYLIIIISLLYQIVKLGYFFSKVTTSVTEEEADIVNLIDNSKSVLYLNNLKEDASSFRSFNWLVVLVGSERFTIKEDLKDVDYGSYDYIFIRDKASSSYVFNGFNKIFEGKNVLLYGAVK